MGMALVAGAEGGAAGVQERLEAFVARVAAPLGRTERRRGAEAYVRGMLTPGARKSLEPVVERLGGGAVAYESLQHFIADSPWPVEPLLAGVAREVVPVIDPVAWVVDDTGFPKDGTHSPGVARQYCGALGKVANCQVGVSVHAVGTHGTLPLGWALYLPERWCVDPERRRRAKIPHRVGFRTKPELAADLIARATQDGLGPCPVLADQAYGDNSAFRERLYDEGVPYVLAIGPRVAVWGPETRFAVPARQGVTGRVPHVPLPSQAQEPAAELVGRLGPQLARAVDITTGPNGTPRRVRGGAIRVCAAHPVTAMRHRPRWEWLVFEWPEHAPGPSDLWLSDLPPDTPLSRLIQLARLRWTVELDYRQLKGELGLDHYEGRSYLGWHHHCALVTVAHAFLTLERLDPKARRTA